MWKKNTRKVFSAKFNLRDRLMRFHVSLYIITTTIETIYLVYIYIYLCCGPSVAVQYKYELWCLAVSLKFTTVFGDDCNVSRVRAYTQRIHRGIYVCACVCYITPPAW